MDNKSTISRKKFLNLFLSGSILTFFASILFPVIRYMIPPKLPEAIVSSVNVGKTGDLALNSGKIFKFGRQPGLLIRTKDDRLLAFIAECTHLDCTVQYRGDLGLIWCACHNGKYDLNGKNISGPPPKPLTRLDVQVSDQDIYVTKQT